MAASKLLAGKAERSVRAKTSTLLKTLAKGEQDEQTRDSDHATTPAATSGKTRPVPVKYIGWS